MAVYSIKSYNRKLLSPVVEVLYVYKIVDQLSDLTIGKLKEVYSWSN